MANTLFDITTATKIQKVYDDTNTKAYRGISVFEADLDHIPEGYYIIGQAAVKQTHADDVPLTSIILVKPSDPDLVKRPVNYILKWNDKKSHGQKSGSFWQVVPPENYVALSDVVTNTYAEPTTKFTSKFACLRKSDVIPATLHDDNLWDDKGSGATMAGSVWQIDGQGLAGMFKVQSGYEKPEEPVYVISPKVIE